MAINERNYVGFALSPTTGNPHRIRHLPQMAEWEQGVYMYEAGDKFVAGIDGIDNLPAQQLANRTEFLREQNALLAEACRGLISIVRETSVGKVAANPLPVMLSRERPGRPCFWAETAGAPDVPTECAMERTEGCVADVAGTAAAAIEEMAEELAVSMTGATSIAAGASGMVPAPAAEDQAKFLRGDGAWADPPVTAFAVGTAQPTRTDVIWIQTES